MTVRVPRIELNESLKQIVATVDFDNEPDFPSFTAEVIVFLDDHDRSISDVKAEAIQKAKDFLSRASLAH